MEHKAFQALGEQFFQGDATLFAQPAVQLFGTFGRGARVNVQLHLFLPGNGQIAFHALTKLVYLALIVGIRQVYGALTHTELHL